jgi:hypothetical protein
MSEELLNLPGDLLENEELDVEGHVKNKGAEDASEDTGDEVEAHLLNENLLDQKLLNDDLLDL